MTRYLLDTNTVIQILKPGGSKPARRLREERPVNIGVSSVALHELFYGAFKSARTQHNCDVIDGLMFDIVPFDREDARAAGEVRAALATAGSPIGPYDVLIAGQALARDLILVTHNTREFSRVPKLRIEDWED